MGDKKGRVGAGLGKAPDVRSAIQKGIVCAKKNIRAVNLSGTTIPHEVRIKKGAAKLYLRPAPPGSGIIAGGAVRSIAELAGIKDLSAKILGTRNKISNVYATLEALEKLKSDSDTRAPETVTKGDIKKDKK